MEFLYWTNMSRSKNKKTEYGGELEGLVFVCALFLPALVVFILTILSVDGLMLFLLGDMLHALRMYHPSDRSMAKSQK